MSRILRRATVLAIWACTAAAGCGQAVTPAAVHIPAGTADAVDLADSLADSVAGAPAVDAPPADQLTAPDGAADAPGTVDATAVTTDTGSGDGSVPGDAEAACLTAAECAASVCQESTCVNGTCATVAKPDGAACANTEPCATSSACQQGACQAVGLKPCGDNNPCTTDACDPTSGACVHQVSAGQPCDDGNACTKGDFCSTKGTCTPGSNGCVGCWSTADCAQYDDGNLCNGTLFCNVEENPPTCKVVPTSVVLCDSSADSACAHAACDPANGTCAMVPLADGAACDDGNSCTQEACNKGSCTAKVNVCQCQSDGDCAAFDDSNACNGTLFCDKAALPYQCKVNAATVVSCPKSNDLCLASTCEVKSGACGMAAVQAGVPCSDGSPKTVGDVCAQGKCVPGVDVSVCKATADCAKLEDGDLCNGTKFCNLATGQCQDNPATVVSCPNVDDTACEKNQCQPKSGICQKVILNEGLACDDGNPCSSGDVCEKGKCVASALTCICEQDADCAAKEDGDLCNGTLFCDKLDHTCKVNAKTIVTCPSVDDTVCAKRSCSAKTGQCPLVPAPDGVACDDGNPCSTGDACQKGNCAGSTDTCVCKKDADCATKEDGNVCNGTLYCDLVLHACKVNPATVVVCPTALDSICQKTQCNPGGGQCEQVGVNAGAACDADGNPCTANDACVDGVCKPGALVCNCQTDGDCSGKQGQNLCIGVMVCEPKSHECLPAKLVTCATGSDGSCEVTACDPASGTCKTNPRPDGVVCEANSLCNGAQTCLAGSCVQGPPVDCDDANPCTAESCESKQGGCLHLALDTTPCSDGSACTTNDACAKGNCVGATLPCDDNESCTVDACDAKLGCSHAAVPTTACNDGNACTISDYCTAGACKGGAAPDCVDGNPCTKDACNTTTGCEHAAEATGTACDDGNACTTGDGCVGGTCGGAGVDCNDNNPCTADSCAWNAGCKHVPATAACDDQNACSVGDTCQSGLCKAGAKLDCEDGSPCTQNACAPASGCTATVVDGPCTDGNPCTTGDGCAKGECAGGSLLDCADGNPCTLDNCTLDAACVHKAGAGACDDGNPCTQDDACFNAVCMPGSYVNCDDSNVCTLDNCDSKGNCVHGAAGGACNDSNPCTVSDTCAAGACSGGTALGCADGNPCTDDTCVTASGCVHLANLATCTDGSSCTSGDHCVGGNCAPGQGLNCDDANPCSSDSCDMVGGCKHKAAAGACDDGNACTVADVCSAGKCLAGGVAVCDDNNACTTDSCSALTGCISVPVSGGACSDGDACTAADACVGSLCVGGSLADCSDGNACTLDTCASGIGCHHTAQPVACDDGNGCTTGDACSGGTCAGTGGINCSDGNVCTADGCSGGKCAHVAQLGACDDGNVCTLGEVCKAGDCQGGTELDCDDGNACTADSCLSPSGCKSVSADGAACVDGNLCTSGDKCVGGQCAGAGDLDCNDGNPCTTDSCGSATGCAHKANSNACDDGNPCTKSDACLNAVCTPGAYQNCDDGNVCTTDGCDTAGNCLATAKPGNCNDGNACTHSDACAAGSCSGTAISCNDGSICTTDLCESGTGNCVYVPLSGGGCSDGSQCTTSDACKNGNCSGTGIVCNDNNGCTNDSCSAVGGCVFSANAIACNDGNACTAGDTCGAAVCAGNAFSCDDANVCTTDLCDGVGGCSNVGNAVACQDDGNVCTTDVCSGGSCGHTANTLACADDSNPCTTDQCAAGGCGHTGNTLACVDDGNLCTNDHCVAGTCTHPANKAACTDDGNACTLDACNGGACGHVGNGAACASDGNACTNDVCVGTACAHPPNFNTCSDDSLCTFADVCAGGACIATFVDCDDGNACTADSCQPTSGCKHELNNAASCDDANPCTTADACQGANCAGVNTVAGSYCPAGTCSAGSCTACPAGMVSLSVDGGGVCAFDYPVWGNRPISPVGVYTENPDGTLSDSQTKLMWQRILPAGSITSAAAQAYCDGLVLGSNSDWRLPTVAELESVVDYTKSQPAIDAVALPTPYDAQQWTAVFRPGNIQATSGQGGDMFFVNFYSGGLGYGLPGQVRQARCVRGGLPKTAGISPRFTVVGPNVVLDGATGLHWQQSAPASAGGNVQACLDYCKTLSLAGAGWRLPTIRELASLLDRTSFANSIDPVAFPNFPADGFWSSTPSTSEQEGDAWWVAFTYSTTNVASATLYGRPVRCVR